MFIKDSNGNSFEYSEGNAYSASYVGANRSMEPQLIFPDAFRRMP